MKRTIISVILFLISIQLLPAQSVQADINEHVWKPFIEAYKTNNVELFNALHSDEVLRIGTRGIQVGSAYKNQNENSFAMRKEKSRTLQIDFSFYQRLDNGDVAYEVGVYKLTVDEPNGPREFYGYFHVVLRKVEGRWKIVQDWDGNEVLGETVDAEDFNNGRKMDDFTK